LLAYDLLHPPDRPVYKADFYAMRMSGGTGQDVFYNALGQFAGGLILLQDDPDQ